LHLNRATALAKLNKLDASIKECSMALYYNDKYIKVGHILPMLMLIIITITIIIISIITIISIIIISIISIITIFSSFNHC